MGNKKYKLTEEVINFDGRKLHRIRALKDFGYVKKGDLGGFVEFSTNLSQYGDCWIYDDGKVFDKAIVCNNAIIDKTAIVKDEAEIYDNAQITDNAVVKDNARVFCQAEVGGSAVIKNEQRLIGNMYSEVDNFIDIQNPNGRMVTCILKNNQLLFNVGCQEEITEEEFKDRILYTNGGILHNPHRQYYLTIIKMAHLWADDILNEK